MILLLSLKRKMAFLLILMLPLYAIAQENKETDTLALIDALFEDWNSTSPGGAIYIKKDGEVRYNKAFGMANLEHGVENTPETVFEAGSVSKQFTAAALLLLVMDGELSLDDDVRDHVPELPEYDETIRIRHLLNHTSGLKDWGSVAAVGGWPRTSRVYTQDLARDYIFRQKGLNNSPGEEYLYSNSNYTLLVTIVERVSGQSLPSFTEERIFKPLGMDDTRWRDNFKKVVPGRAIGYSRSGGEYLQNMPFENTYGHAALLTTTADLVTWNDSWMSHELGGKDLSDLRIERGRLLNDTEISYAAAVMVDEVNGETQISHSGATAGYRAWLAYYPKSRLSVAFLSNDGNVSPVAVGKAIAELYLGKEERSSVYESRPLTEDHLREKQGLFKNENNHSLLELEVKDEGLYLGSNELRAISPDTLYRNETLYIFNGDRLVVNAANGPVHYTRVEKWEPEGTELQEYTGHYSSEVAAGALEIEIKDDLLYAKSTPSREEELTPSFNDGFYVGRNKLYEFVRDADGKITGLNISVTRAENLYFEKL